MNNQELELKVKELAKIENFFDLAIAVQNLRTEYKDSEFYKTTRISFDKIIEKALVFYKLNLTTMLEKLQNTINNIDAEHLIEVIDNMGEMFNAENNDVMNNLQMFKDITSKN